MRMIQSYEGENLQSEHDIAHLVLNLFTPDSDT